MTLPGKSPPPTALVPEARKGQPKNQDIGQNRILIFLSGVGTCLALILGIGIAIYLLSGGAWPTLEDTNQYAEIAKSLAQIAAFVVAGLWTYRLFIMNRIEYPFPECECNVQHFPIAEDKQILNVTIRLKNVGQVLLQLEHGEIIIEQIRPLSKYLGELIADSDENMLKQRSTEGLFKGGGQYVAWPEIGHLCIPGPEERAVHIEPGETDVLSYEFVVSKSVRTVKIFGYFDNKYVTTKANELLGGKSGESEIGWHVVQIYDIEEGAKTKDKRGSKSIGQRLT